METTFQFINNKQKQKKQIQTSLNRENIIDINDYDIKIPKSWQKGIKNCYFASINRRQFHWYTRPCVLFPMNRIEYSICWKSIVSAVLLSTSRLKIYASLPSFVPLLDLYTLLNGICYGCALYVWEEQQLVGFSSLIIIIDDKCIELWVCSLTLTVERKRGHRRHK